MNVMKKAHELARVVVANAPGKGVYAYAFKLALIHAHKEYKAMVKAQNAYNDGQEAFKAGTSSNPYKECTDNHNSFKAGWMEAKQDHYNSNEGTVTVATAYNAGKAAFKANKEVTANRYKGLDATAWEDGWYTAMQEDALKDIL